MRPPIGFVEFFRNFIPNLGTKPIPFYKLFLEAYLEVDETHVKALEVLERHFIDATKITLQLAKPGLQYVLLCDASCHGAGFVLIVEDETKVLPSGKQNYDPVSFGSHLFNTAQLKFLFTTRNFLHFMLR